MKRALAVGIDKYFDPGFPTLSGCVRDANAVLPLLENHENNDKNFDCRALGLSEEQPDVIRDEFVAAIEALFRDGADMAVLFFAGHGLPKGDTLNLVTSDGTAVSPGVPFTTILEIISQSPVDEIVILLDCCFSGRAGRIPAISKDLALLRSGVSILTASRGGQSAVELSGRGQFSVLLESGLQGGAADVLGQVSVAGLYSYISESFGAWDQRPTFMANVERLQTIRKCAASVDPTVLKELPNWFENPATPHALDPSYEPTSPLPADVEEIQRYERNRTMFRQMQKCAGAKLIVPVDADHMYYAAIESKWCKLTHLGAHYWELAKKRQL
jgi:hypothetical protein